MEATLVKQSLDDSFNESEVRRLEKEGVNSKASRPQEPEEYIPLFSTNQGSGEIRAALANLSESNRRIYASKSVSIQKNAGIAYVLWFFLGGFGIHKFYIGLPGWGIVYIICFITGWALLFPLIFLALFLIVDLFAIPSHCEMSVKKKKLKLISDLLETQ